MEPCIAIKVELPRRRDEPETSIDLGRRPLLLFTRIKRQEISSVARGSARSILLLAHMVLASEMHKSRCNVDPVLLGLSLRIIASRSGKKSLFQRRNLVLWGARAKWQSTT